MIRLSASSDGRTRACTTLSRVSSPLRLRDERDARPRALSPMRDPFAPARAWLAARGMTAFAFQEEVWGAYAAGRSGLVHAPTGMGKTLAAAVPPLLLGAEGAAGEPPPLSLLWITPLRALAADTGLALADARARAAPATGRRRAHRRHRRGRARATAAAPADGARHDAGEPDAVALARRLARALRAISPRRRRRVARAHRHQARRADGARARAPAALAPGSAHLGTVGDARQSRRGARVRSSVRRARTAALVARLDAKAIVIDTLLPRTIERFPWAGHIGLKLAAAGDPRDRAARTTLVFTNVRSQTEIWYQATLEARPDWAGTIALHHGSLERDVARLGRGRAAQAARCARSSARRASISASISRRSTRCCRSAARRASRACCSAPVAAATVPAQSRASPSCRRRRSSWSRRPPRARPRPRARSSRACRSCAARRARPASRHVRARRRLPAGRAPGRGSRHARVPRALRRRVAVRARLRRPRRRSLNAYPEYRRVVIGDDGVAPRARRGDRAPAPDRHRHHRLRGDDHGAPAQRPGARPRRGRLHRAARPRRLRSSSPAACWSSSACAS